MSSEGGGDPIRAGGADDDGGGSGEPLISVAISLLCGHFFMIRIELESQDHATS